MNLFLSQINPSQFDEKEKKNAGAAALVLVKPMKKVVKKAGGGEVRVQVGAGVKKAGQKAVAGKKGEVQLLL